MSAFLCNDDHISYIVQAGLQYKSYCKIGEYYGPITRENDQQVFEILKKANLLSLRARYGEKDSEGNKEIGKLKYVPLNISPVQTLKALDCFEYQACEDDSWNTSDAYRIIEYIRSSAIRRLPGYEDAKYEITIAKEATNGR